MALTDQPGVDDLPFIPSPGLELDQRRPLVLQFEKELQGVPAGRLVRFDGLGLQPPVPFPDDQSPGVLLLHPSGPNLTKPCEGFDERTRWPGSRERTRQRSTCSAVGN